jgi:HprK-related kinase A
MAVSMAHVLTLTVGPATFRLHSPWREPVRQMRALYQTYPQPDPANVVADLTVRLDPATPLRRWLRPSVRIAGDYTLPEAQPMALAHGLLAAEMGMNLQMALGWRRHLILHASCVEKDGRALVMTGESGSGKSTLSALLGERGWRFLGDEFALVDPVTGAMLPFPRAVSLKNSAIKVAMDHIPADRFGPELAGTPKGTIRHLIPRADAIAAMDRPAMPALLLFPRYGHAKEARPVDPAEVFMRLTQASTNYVALGEAGFVALTRFAQTVPGVALDYPDTQAALDGVDELWRTLPS